MYDLKTEALDERQYLDRLLNLYFAFQEYVEALKPLVRGESVEPDLLAAVERFRLKYQEYDNLFYEWHEGEQTLNAGIAAFVRYPYEFRNNEHDFEIMLMLATEKFQHILEQRALKIKEVHEHIALQEGQAKAEEITHVPKSAVEKIKAADSLADIAFKWGGRALVFAPWAVKIVESLGGR
jgi:hypothetical protein